MVVVGGGGILIEDTIWASSKGKRCQASLIGLSGHKGHPSIDTIKEIIVIISMKGKVI